MKAPEFYNSDCEFVSVAMTGGYITKYPNMFGEAATGTKTSDGQYTWTLQKAFFASGPMSESINFTYTWKDLTTGSDWSYTTAQSTTLSIVTTFSSLCGPNGLAETISAGPLTTPYYLPPPSSTGQTYSFSMES